MRVLLLGSGAREHALAVALAADPAVTELHAAPGNPGIARVARVHPVDLTEIDALAGLAVELQADLVVVGPEAPLVAGAADAIRAKGIACFGPSAAAARLEGSKDFAKSVMAAAGVPTARSRTCATVDEVGAALDEFGAPHVVKDDGLAAGKGVLVTGDRAAALAHAGACLAGRAPGAARVVVEEYLAGPEASLFVVTDGEAAVPLLPAQDFKRIGDGDTGPNTGGMGAYAPLPWAPPDLVDRVMAEVVEPTLAEMRRRGAPFAGLLYVGLALTPDSGAAPVPVGRPAGDRAEGSAPGQAAGQSSGTTPKVIEFNCRFGDPETQAVLALLETPLAGLLHAAATGALADHPPLRWRPGAAVTVVLASSGYPGAARTGDVITGADRDGVLHAGTARQPDGELVSAGGRVLCATATGASVARARQTAYELLGGVGLAGGQFRTDIAAGV